MEPRKPHLYGVELRLLAARKDFVRSYFECVVLSRRNDKRVAEATLNNKPYFHNGLLDQGYW